MLCFVVIKCTQGPEMKPYFVFPLKALKNNFHFYQLLNMSDGVQHEHTIFSKNLIFFHIFRICPDGAD